MIPKQQPQQKVKQRPRAGLLLFINSKFILIKTRRFEAYHNQGSFERTQIPRGGVESLLDNNVPFIAAMREFIEETRLLPIGECWLCRESFTLKWLNNNRWHEYQLFLLIASEAKYCNRPVLFVSWGSSIFAKFLGLIREPYTKFGNASLIRHVSDTFIQSTLKNYQATLEGHNTTNEESYWNVSSSTSPTSSSSSSSRSSPFEERVGNLLVIIAPNLKDDRIHKSQMQYDTQYEVVQLTLSEFIHCKIKENGSNTTNYWDLFNFLYNKLDGSINKNPCVVAAANGEKFLPITIRFSTFTL